MSAVDIVRKLAATNSSTDKKQIVLDAWMSGERDFFTGVKLAYDILISFGVAKVAQITADDSPGAAASTYTFQDFLELAEKLRKRELTGTAAKNAIHDAAERSDTAMWNEFYRGILLKDLRCGVTDTIVNSVLEKVGKSDKEALEYVTPVFSCQLAKDGADEANAKHMVGEKLLDVKLDGVRLLTVVDKELRTVVQYTRNGKINDRFPHIRDVFERMMDDLPCSMVFDGEITAKSFQDLMTQVNRKSDKNTGDTKLALFDCLPLEDFHAGKCMMSQEDRHAVLTGYYGLMLTLATAGEVYVVPKKKVNLSTKEGQDEFAAFNKEALLAGYEGIMVKDPAAPYECKRTKSWLKVKPFMDVTMEIVGWEEGTGKNVGKLGAFMMKGEEDGKQVEVNCGGGFSDKERAEFWANKEAMKGTLWDVRCDALTLERNSTDIYSMRFPRWCGRPRGHKPGEKI